MKIRKVINSVGTYDVYLNKDEKTLGVFYDQNQDMYMTLTNGRDIPEEVDVSIYFDITKDDGEIYKIFDETYQNIIEGKIPVDDNESRTGYKKSLVYQKLVSKSKSIYWISDGETLPHEEAMKITKIADIYRLTFHHRGKSIHLKNEDLQEIAVKFSGYNSRYFPFNYLFIGIYQKLQDIVSIYQDNEFEEIGHCKKLNSKRGGNYG